MDKKEEEILAIFIKNKEYPTKAALSRVLGVSPSTFRRNGFVLSRLQTEYRARTVVLSHCKLCQAVCKRGGVFCSQSCSAIYNNSLRVVTPRNKCLNCDNPVKYKNAKYCGVSCNKEYEYNTFIENWLNGSLTLEPVTASVPIRIRRYLFEKHNCACSCCGWSQKNPTTGKVPLEVDHINGDSSDNSPGNLTLLCPNCHSLTSTYKALNKGNGRHSRMQRYRENKSY